MKIQDVEVGRKVIYTPFKGCDPNQLEEGVITSFNEQTVFVRYGDDIHAKGTHPRDLQYSVRRVSL